MQTCICPSWCHCHSLSLASVKSRLVLPFWYRLTRVVPEKGPLNGCVCVCVFLTLKPCWLHQQNHSTRDCFPQPAAEIQSLKEAEHHYCLFFACLWVCSATFLTISSRFQIAGGSEDLHLMMVESHQPVGTLTKHTITHCILKQYWTVEIKCTKHCIPASSSVCKLQTDLTTAVVKYNEIYWNCLQCFHAVGWAAGRASGL